MVCYPQQRSIYARHLKKSLVKLAPKQNKTSTAAVDPQNLKVEVTD